MATTDEDEREVRTTLDDEEYAAFQRVIEDRGLSLEEGLRCAVRDYVEFHDEVESLLETVDSLDAVGEPTDASELDQYLYGAAEEDASR